MDRAKALHFHCRHCGERFEAEPGSTVPVPDRDWQPLDYFAECILCGETAAQAGWELGLAKAWTRATGPRTPEGMAATAANLVGHPTPEEAQRTRFNAMKHGAFAKTATYWPAKPGSYPHCKTCEHFNQGCDEYPRRGHKNPPACLKRVELFMRFNIAFETRDPRLLSDHAATLQALVWQMTNDMILTVIQDGVSLRSPEWYYDKEGSFHLAQYPDDSGEIKTIEKVQAHPLLRFIIEFMNRNGMTLPDSGMTMKAQDEEESIRGFIQQDGETQEQGLAFQKRQTEALEGLRGLIERSQSRMARDPVLIEHAALDTEKGAEA